MVSPRLPWFEVCNTISSDLASKTKEKPQVEAGLESGEMANKLQNVSHLCYYPIRYVVKGISTTWHAGFTMRSICNVLLE